MQWADRVNIIHALRVTIHALEQDAEPPHAEQPDLTALKSILLRRISDLERADESASTEIISDEP